MNSKTVLTLIVASSLAACASTPTTQPIADISVLQNQDLTLVAIREDGPPFMSWSSPGSAFAMAMGGAIGGGLSAAMAIGKGKDAVTEYDIPSPSLQIEDALKQAVSTKYSIEISDNDLVYPLDEKPRKDEDLDLSKDHLYIDTVSSLGAGGNNVTLSANMRIVDGVTSAVIGYHICSAVAYGPDDEKPKNESALRENNGELLKSKIREMADKCSDEFIENVLEASAIDATDDATTEDVAES